MKSLLSWPGKLKGKIDDKMSFECPHFLEGVCNLQNGSCHPAIGKCILKGKAVRAKDIQNSENTITIPESE